MPSITISSALYTFILHLGQRFSVNFVFVSLHGDTGGDTLLSFFSCVFLWRTGVRFGVLGENEDDLGGVSLPRLLVFNRLKSVSTPTPGFTD